RGDAERGELPRDPEKPPVLTVAEGVVAPGPYQPHPDHHASRHPHCNVGIDGRAGRAQSGKKGRSVLRDAARSSTADGRARDLFKAVTSVDREWNIADFCAVCRGRIVAGPSMCSD